MLVVVEALVFILVVYFGYPYLWYTQSNRKIMSLCQPFTPCIIDQLDFIDIWAGTMRDMAILQFVDRPSKEGLKKLRKSGRKYQIAYKRNIPFVVRDLYKETYNDLLRGNREEHPEVAYKTGLEIICGD